MPYPVSMSTNFLTLSKPSEPIRESNSSSQWAEILTAIRNVGDFIHKNVIDHFPPTVLGLMYSASMPAIMIPSDESSFGKRHGLEFIKFAVIESAISMK